MLRLQNLDPVGLFEDLSYMKGLAIPLAQFSHLKNSKVFSRNKQCFKILREKKKSHLQLDFFFFLNPQIMFLFLTFEYILSIGVLQLVLHCFKENMAQGNFLKFIYFFPEDSLWKQISGWKLEERPQWTIYICQFLFFQPFTEAWQFLPGFHTIVNSRNFSVGCKTCLRACVIYLMLITLCGAPNGTWVN